MKDKAKSRMQLSFDFHTWVEGNTGTQTHMLRPKGSLDKKS